MERCGWFKKVGRGARFSVQNRILNMFGNVRCVGHTDAVTGILACFKYDSLFTSARDGEIIQWSLSGQRMVRSFVRLGKMITCIELTHDEEILLACCPTIGICMFRTRESSNTQNYETLPFTDGAVIMKLSRDSQYLAFNCKDYTITVLNFHSKTKFRTFLLCFPDIKGLGFFYDLNYLVYCSASNKIFIVDFEKNETENITSSYTLLCIACGKISNKFAVGLTNNSIALYETNPTKKKIYQTNHLSFIYQLEFSQNDDFLLSSSYDKTLRIHSLQTDSISKVIKCCSTPKSFTFTPDLSKIFIGFDHIIQSNLLKSFDLTLDKFESGFNCHSRPISRIVFKKDYKEVFTDATDGTLRLWDCQSGVQVSLIVPSKNFECFALSHNEKTLVFGCRNELIVWNLEMNSEKFRVKQDVDSCPELNFFILQNKFLVFQHYKSYMLDLDTKEIRDLKVKKYLSINSQLKIDEEYFITNYEGGRIIFWKNTDECKPVFEYDSRHRMRNLWCGGRKKYLVVALKSNRFAVFDFEKIRMIKNKL